MFYFELNNFVDYNNHYCTFMSVRYLLKTDKTF